MKKILVLVLAFACLLSLVACGGNSDNGGNDGNGGSNDSVLTSFAQSVKNSEPDTIECEIEVETSSGDSIGATITYLADEIDDIDVEYFNTLTPGSTPSSKPTKVDAFKKFSDKNPIDLSELSFNTEYFKNGEYTIEGDVFKAVVTNPTAFFGTEIGAGNVNVEITLSNGEVDSIVITYTVSGASVAIEMSYE